MDDRQGGSAAGSKASRRMAGGGRTFYFVSQFFLFLREWEEQPASYVYVLAGILLEWLQIVSLTFGPPFHYEEPIINVVSLVVFASNIPLWATEYYGPVNYIVFAVFVCLAFSVLLMCVLFAVGLTIKKIDQGSMTISGTIRYALESFATWLYLPILHLFLSSLGCSDSGRVHHFPEQICHSQLHIIIIIVSVLGLVLLAICGFVYSAVLGDVFLQSNTLKSRPHNYVEVALYFLKTAGVVAFHIFVPNGNLHIYSAFVAVGSIFLLGLHGFMLPFYNHKMTTLRCALFSVSTMASVINFGTGISKSVVADSGVNSFVYFALFPFAIIIGVSIASLRPSAELRACISTLLHIGVVPRHPALYPFRRGCLVYDLKFAHPILRGLEFDLLTENEYFDEEVFNVAMPRGFSFGDETTNHTTPTNQANPDMPENASNMNEAEAANNSLMEQSRNIDNGSPQNNTGEERRFAQQGRGRCLSGQFRDLGPETIFSQLVKGFEPAMGIPGGASCVGYDGRVRDEGEDDIGGGAGMRRGGDDDGIRAGSDQDGNTTIPYTMEMFRYMTSLRGQILVPYINDIVLRTDAEIACRFVSFQSDQTNLQPSPSALAFACRIYTKSLLQWKGSGTIKCAFANFLYVHANRLHVALHLLNEVDQQIDGDQNIMTLYISHKIGSKVRELFGVRDTVHRYTFNRAKHHHKEALSEMSQFWSKLITSKNDITGLAVISSQMTKRRQSAVYEYQRSLASSKGDRLLLSMYASFLKDVMGDEAAAEEFQMLAQDAAEEKKNRVMRGSKAKNHVSSTIGITANRYVQAMIDSDALDNEDMNLDGGSGVSSTAILRLPTIFLVLLAVCSMSMLIIQRVRIDQELSTIDTIQRIGEVRRYARESEYLALVANTEKAKCLASSSLLGAAVASTGTVAPTETTGFVGTFSNVAASASLQSAYCSGTDFLNSVQALSLNDINMRYRHNTITFGDHKPKGDSQADSILKRRFIPMHSTFYTDSSHAIGSNFAVADMIGVNFITQQSKTGYYEWSQFDVGALRSVLLSPWLAVHFISAHVTEMLDRMVVGELYGAAFYWLTSFNNVHEVSEGLSRLSKGHQGDIEMTARGYFIALTILFVTCIVCIISIFVAFRSNLQRVATARVNTLNLFALIPYPSQEAMFTESRTLLETFERTHYEGDQQEDEPHLNNSMTLLDGDAVSSPNGGRTSPSVNGHHRGRRNSLSVSVSSSRHTSQSGRSNKMDSSVSGSFYSPREFLGLDGAGNPIHSTSHQHGNIKDPQGYSGDKQPHLGDSTLHNSGSGRVQRRLTQSITAMGKLWVPKTLFSTPKTHTLKSILKKSVYGKKNNNNRQSVMSKQIDGSGKFKGDKKVAKCVSFSIEGEGLTSPGTAVQKPKGRIMKEPKVLVSQDIVVDLERTMRLVEKETDAESEREMRRKELQTDKLIYGGLRSYQLTKQKHEERSRASQRRESRYMIVNWNVWLRLIPFLMFMGAVVAFGVSFDFYSMYSDSRSETAQRATILHNSIQRLRDLRVFANQFILTGRVSEYLGFTDLMLSSDIDFKLPSAVTIARNTSMDVSILRKELYSAIYDFMICMSVAARGHVYSGTTLINTSVNGTVTSTPRRAANDPLRDTIAVPLSLVDVPILTSLRWSRDAIVDTGTMLADSALGLSQPLQHYLPGLIDLQGAATRLQNQINSDPTFDPYNSDVVTKVTGMRYLKDFKAWEESHGNITGSTSLAYENTWAQQVRVADMLVNGSEDMLALARIKVGSRGLREKISAFVDQAQKIAWKESLLVSASSIQEKQWQNARRYDEHDNSDSAEFGGNTGARSTSSNFEDDFLYLRSLGDRSSQSIQKVEEQLRQFLRIGSKPPVRITRVLPKLIEGDEMSLEGARATNPADTSEALLISINIGIYAAFSMVVVGMTVSLAAFITYAAAHAQHVYRTGSLRSILKTTELVVFTCITLLLIVLSAITIIFGADVVGHISNDPGTPNRRFQDMLAALEATEQLFYRMSVRELSTTLSEGDSESFLSYYLLRASDNVSSSGAGITAYSTSDERQRKEESQSSTNRRFQAASTTTATHAGSYNPFTFGYGVVIKNLWTAVDSFLDSRPFKPLKDDKGKFVSDLEAAIDHFLGTIETLTHIQDVALFLKKASVVKADYIGSRSTNSTTPIVDMALYYPSSPPFIRTYSFQTELNAAEDVAKYSTDAPLLSYTTPEADLLLSPSRISEMALQTVFGLRGRAYTQAARDALVGMKQVISRHGTEMITNSGAHYANVIIVCISLTAILAVVAIIYVAVPVLSMIAFAASATEDAKLLMTTLFIHIIRQCQAALVVLLCIIVLQFSLAIITTDMGEEGANVMHSAYARHSVVTSLLVDACGLREATVSSNMLETTRLANRMEDGIVELQQLQNDLYQASRGVSWYGTLNVIDGDQRDVSFGGVDPLNSLILTWTRTCIKIVTTAKQLTPDTFGTSSTSTIPPAFLRNFVISTKSLLISIQDDVAILESTVGTLQAAIHRSNAVFGTTIHSELNNTAVPDILTALAVILLVIIELRFIFRPVADTLIAEEAGTNLMLRMIPQAVRETVPKITLFLESRVYIDLATEAELHKECEITQVFLSSWQTGVAEDDCLLLLSRPVTEVPPLPSPVSDAREELRKDDSARRDRRTVAATRNGGFSAQARPTSNSGSPMYPPPSGEGMGMPVMTDIGASSTAIKKYSGSIILGMMGVGGFGLEKSSTYYSRGCGYVLIDSKGIVKFVNPAMKNLLGYTMHNLQGKNVKMLMDEPLRSQHDGFINRFVTQGTSRILGTGRDVMVVANNGERVHIFMHVHEAVRHTGEMFFLAQLSRYVIASVSSDGANALAGKSVRKAAGEKRDARDATRNTAAENSS